MRDRQREETSAAILRAAEIVFGEQGIHRAGMSEIAARAGVAVGTLYNHFADRDALLTGLYDLHRRELIEQLDALEAEPSSGVFADDLSALLRTLFSNFETHRSFFSLIFQGEHSGLKKPSATAQVVRTRVEKLMRRGLRQKVLRARPAKLYAIFLMGLVRGTLIQHLHGDPIRDLDRRADEIVDLFINGAKR